jgi:hypothetical protein
MQTHARDPVTVVGAIEKHPTSQHWNRAWQGSHGDGESVRGTTAGNGESSRESAAQAKEVFFLLSAGAKGRQEEAVDKVADRNIFFTEADEPSWAGEPSWRPMLSRADSAESTTSWSNRGLRGDGESGGEKLLRFSQPRSPVKKSSSNHVLSWRKAAAGRIHVVPANAPPPMRVRSNRVDQCKMRVRRVDVSHDLHDDDFSIEQLQVRSWEEAERKAGNERTGDDEVQ